MIDVRRFVLSCAALTIACTPSDGARPAPSAATARATVPDAPRKASKTSHVVVLMGEDAPRHARWASNGDLLTHTSKSVWRLSPRSFAGKVLPFDDVISDFTVARHADVFAVVHGKSSVVVQGPKGRRKFDIPSTARNATAELSPDGTRLTIVAAGKTTLHDVTSGDELGTLGDGGVVFDDSGAYVATESGMYSASDGKVIEAFKPGSFVGGFIGARLVVFDNDGIALVDGEKKAVVRFGARCRNETSRIDQIDTILKRAVRGCAEGVVVVNVEKLARVDVKLSKPAVEIHDVGFLEGSSNIVVRTTDETSYEKPLLVDLEKRATRALAANEPLRVRDPSSNVVTEFLGGEGCTFAGVTLPAGACGGVVSPDKKSLVADVRGEITVYDVATGAARMTVGHAVPRSPSGTLSLVPRARGLDLVVSTPSPPELRVLRHLGPTAPDVPPHKASITGKSCSRGKRPLYRRIGDRDVLYDAFSPRACLCTNGDCVDAMRPGVMRFHDFWGDLALTDAFDTKGPAKKGGTAVLRVAALDGSREVKADPQLGRCLGAAFADDGQSVVAPCVEAEDGPVELVELSASDMKPKARTRLDVAVEHGITVAAGKSHVLLSRWELDGRVNGTVVDRKTGKAVARVNGGETFVLVTYPDGTMEIGGEPPPGAVACVFGDDVRPFEACRAEVEVKARFTFE